MTEGAHFCFLLELVLVVCEEPPLPLDDESCPSPCHAALSLMLSSTFLFLDSAALFTIQFGQ